MINSIVSLAKFMSQFRWAVSKAEPQKLRDGVRCLDKIFPFWAAVENIAGRAGPPIMIRRVYYGVRTTIINSSQAMQ